MSDLGSIISFSLQMILDKLFHKFHFDVKIHGLDPVDLERHDSDPLNIERHS